MNLCPLSDAPCTLQNDDSGRRKRTSGIGAGLAGANTFAGGEDYGYFGHGMRRYGILPELSALSSSQDVRHRRVANSPAIVSEPGAASYEPQVEIRTWSVLSWPRTGFRIRCGVCWPASGPRVRGWPRRGPGSRNRGYPGVLRVRTVSKPHAD